MTNFLKIEVFTKIFAQCGLESITYHLKTLLGNENTTQHTKIVNMVYVMYCPLSKPHWGGGAMPNGEKMLAVAVLLSD